MTVMVKMSKAGKMPCTSFSLPAQACRTGSKLHRIAGSVCSGCYALKGNYVFPNVKAPREHNLAVIREAIRTNNWTPWVEALVSHVSLEKSGFFRWHDSGDIQSVGHLEAIANVAKRVPHIRFWLPTKEKGDVLEYVRRHKCFPKNLTVRVSAPMIDGAPSSGWGITSTVHKDAAPQGFECGAHTRGGKCGECRACWDPKIRNVSYPKH